MSGTARLWIHVWCPDYFGASGGITRFSNALVQSLVSVPGIECSVFVKNDNSASLADFGLDGAEFDSTGDWAPEHRTAAFGAKIFSRAMMKPPSLIISTHANFSPVARWLKRAAGTPYWVVAHGFEVTNGRDALVAKAVRDADQVFAVSRFTRQRVMDVTAARGERVTVLPNTIGSLDFQPGEKPAYLLDRYSLDRDQPVILTVARLSASERYKGIDRMLESLRSVREVFPKVRYLVVGGGDDRARIKGEAVRAGVAANLIMCGQVPDRELADHYNLCDVFSMPSTGEGFGIVFLEAMACGKPVIAGNRDGSVDALADGELGALVDPTSPPEIAASLIEILSGRHANRLLYDRAELRMRVTEKFGMASFRARIANEIEAFVQSQALSI